MNIPVITATWDIGSTCLISQSTNLAYACMSQDFYNLTLAYPDGSDRNFGIYPPTNIRGTFHLQSGWLSLVTGINDITLSVNNFAVSGGRFTGTSGGGYPFLTIRNDLYISGGTFRITNAGNNARNYEVFARNVNLSGTGIIDLNSRAASSNMGRLHVLNTLTVSGGSLINSQGSTGRTTGICFSGNGEQTFEWSGGTLSTESGGVGRLFMYKTVGGPTLINEVYTAQFPQTTVCGEDISYLHIPEGYAQWPTSGSLIRNVTINNVSGVTLSTNKTVNGAMILTNGIFNLNGFNLTMANNSGIIRTGGSFNSAPLFGTSVNLSYLFNSEAIHTSHEIPVAHGVINNLVINTVNNVYLESDVSFKGVLVFNNGGIELNGYSLSLAHHDLAFGGNNYISDLQVDHTNEPATVGGGTNSVSRKWKLTGSITGVVNITLSWPVAYDNGGDFSGSASVWRYTGFSWIVLATDLAAQTVEGYRSVTFSTSISAKDDSMNEYTVTGEGQTLPVVLASFTAHQSLGGYPLLRWITHSETALLGFYIYRGITDQLDMAVCVSEQITGSNSSIGQTYSYLDSDLTEYGIYSYWLGMVGYEGSYEYHGPITYSFTEEHPSVPAIPFHNGIHSIYPNPFNPTVSIRFGLISSQNVSFRLFNHRGQVVKNLNLGITPAGIHNFLWDGKDDGGQSCSSGIYMVEAVIGKEKYIRKLVMQK